jgi:NTP pyrophosphatase (non-canonical NTP hydrolase)
MPTPKTYTELTFSPASTSRQLVINYLDDLQKQIVQWENKNFPETPDYRNLLGMGEELGELFHAHLKSEQRIRQDATETKEKKKDAIGDLLIYAINYAVKNRLCLLECLESAWEEVKQRDWIKFPKNGKSE